MSKKTLYFLFLTVIVAAFFSYQKFFNSDALFGKDKAEKDGGVVNIYSSRKEELIKDILRAFTQKTGIKVNHVFDDPTKLISRIKSEGKKTHADLFITADVLNLILAAKIDILSPVDSDILKQTIPANLRSDRWFGLTKRVRLIVYSKDRVNVSDLDDYEGLADPKWKDRVLIRSSSNPYNQSLIASIIAADGEDKAREWIRGLVRNMARPPYGGDTDQIRAVAAGEGDVTIVNSYYVARILTSENKSDRKIAERVGVFFPNQDNRGSMVNISGAGIIKDAKNRKNAIRLLEFMTSPEAQEMYAKNNHEYPILASAPLSAQLLEWEKSGVKLDQSPLENLVPHMDLAVKIADEEGWR